MSLDDINEIIEYIKEQTDFKGDIFININKNAIPIEWIEKWGQQFYKVINGKKYYTGDGYDTVWDLLEDWEKENEHL